LIKLSHWFIDRMETIFSHGYSGDQVRDFVLNRYSRLIDSLEDITQPNKTEVANDLGQIHEIILALGWVNKKENPFKAHSIKKQIPATEILTWKRGLRDGKVINAGVVKIGTGFYLDQLEFKGISDQRSFILNNLESLLKHVETRRECCLQAFEPMPDADQIWLERINIILLFVRSARRTNDPRFLNAALKLNDWYFSYFQKKATRPQLVRILLALVEQELALKELYP
jgi:hypothetical protein